MDRVLTIWPLFLPFLEKTEFLRFIQLSKTNYNKLNTNNKVIELTIYAIGSSFINRYCRLSIARLLKDVHNGKVKIPSGTIKKIF